MQHSRIAQSAASTGSLPLSIGFFTDIKKLLVALTSILVLSLGTYAQPIDSLQIRINEIEQALHYQTGTVELESGNATLTVPAGFQFLDKSQSMYVLTDLWGNPADSSVLGMLVPENRGVLADNSWVFAVTYNEMGYVKDDDAADIDYDQMLKDLQKETRDGNAERVKNGYEPIELIGWASNPYYDQNQKTLHWAKEFKFGESASNTLNYNLRILGRKGIYELNAIASMPELPEVKLSIDKVIASVEFKDGHRYADFQPDVDQVAAWTIGGLVAGKVLAKAGFFVFILKFWKLIALGLFGAGGGAWKVWKRKKKGDTSIKRE